MERELNLLDCYTHASAWTLNHVEGAVDQLDAPRGCEGWDVRTLMNHMLQTQRYFVATARGEQGTLTPDPPQLLSDDPLGDFERAREDTLRAFAEPGVIEKTGSSLGIAFSDMLLHGWDLATATGQDATMPEGLPEAAFDMIHGRFTEEQRKGVFEPEIQVGPDASAQDKLLAYTGRAPSR